MAPPACSSSHSPNRLAAKLIWRLHFLLAIAVVVVGDDRDHHAAPIAAGELESARRRCRVRPALASTSRRGAAVRWPRRGAASPDLSSCRPVRCGARITQPVWPVQCVHVEGGIVFRQIGIAAVAEDRLHEIEIADQAARARRSGSPWSWPDRGPVAGQTSGRSSSETKQAGPLLLVGGEGQGERIGRRLERCGEQRGEGRAWGRPSCPPAPAGRPRRCGRCPGWCGGRSWGCAGRPAASDRSEVGRRELVARRAAATSRAPGRGGRAQRMSDGQPGRAARQTSLR